MSKLHSFVLGGVILGIQIFVCFQIWQYGEIIFRPVLESLHNAEMKSYYSGLLTWTSSVPTVICCLFWMFCFLLGFPEKDV